MREGDKVRCVYTTGPSDGLELGAVYTVTRKREDGMIDLEEARPEWLGGGYLAGRFEKEVE